MKISARSNHNLAEYIKKAIQIERFEEPFATLLVETFVRMQYVLELSPQELKEDINNFNNSISQFRYDQLPENTMGWYDPDKYEIVFNLDYWQKMIDTCSPEEYTTKFFEAFAHECLHGTQEVQLKNGNSYNRAGGYNKKIKNRSHAIYEICTQATAAKMARNESYTDFRQGKILSGDGYSDEIFAISLIASTFGISEQEVIKYGQRERNKLIEVLNKHIGNYEYTEKMVNRIENQLEIIHSIGYPDDKQEDFINLSDDERSELETDSILKLTNLCQAAFVTRIRKIPLDVDNKTITALKFDQKKMLDTLRNQFHDYSDDLDMDYWELVYLTTENNSRASFIKGSLNALSEIAKDRHGKYSNYRLEIIDQIKSRDLSRLGDYGLDTERESTVFLAHNDVGLQEKKIRKDYNSLIKWDNSDLEDVLYGRRKKIDFPSKSLYLKNWNEAKLNSIAGKKKLYVLQHVARVTSQTYGGKDIRYTLFEFLKAKPNELENIYNKISNTENARQEFMQEFYSTDDKEFLVKLMAKEYIDKIFDFKYGLSKDLYKESNSETQAEKDVKKYLLPTIQKYGKEYAMLAISKIILEGNFESINNGDINARTNLGLISPNAFLDVISKPLMDGLMEKRVIPEETKKSVTYSIYLTEEKYPGTIAERISRFIEGSRNEKLDFSLFTADGRDELREAIQNQEDLENMIGVICNNYSEKVEAEKYIGESRNIQSRLFKELVFELGPDGFREAIIQAVVNSDYSKIPEYYARYLNSIDNSEIFSEITEPTLEKAYKIDKINASHNRRTVSREDLRRNKEKYKQTLVSNFFSKLNKMFGRDDNDER